MYGHDPVEAYLQLYVPNIAEGMVVTAGRYLSPPDIETQLAPQNYLFTHSLMFTVNAAIKLNKQWTTFYSDRNLLHVSEKLSARGVSVSLSQIDRAPVTVTLCFIFFWATIDQKGGKTPCNPVNYTPDKEWS
jgi:hypothetical protein